MPSAIYQLDRSQFSAAVDDIQDGISRWRLWTALATEDINRRFKRSYLGVLWITLSFAFFVGVKVVIFGRMTDANNAYFTNYVGIGYFAWMYINLAVMDACHVFTSSEGWIKGGRLPYTLFVNVNLARSLVMAFYNFLVVIGLMVIYKVTPTWAAIWSVAVFGLFIVNAFCLNFLLGILCVRQRDMTHLIQAIMRVMLFLTPIFWLPEQMGGLWRYLQFNPFAHFLIAFRDPLLSGNIPWSSLQVVGGVTVVMMLTSFSLFVFARRRIIFWL